jgi:hypothetical protein
MQESEIKCQEDERRSRGWIGARSLALTRADNAKSIGQSMHKSYNMQAESAASCPFSGGARSRPPVQQSARADANRRRSIWTHSHVWPRAPLEALVAAGRGCFSRLRPLRSLSLSRCCGRGRGWIDKWCVLSSAAALSAAHTRRRADRPTPLFYKKLCFTCARFFCRLGSPIRS